MDDHACLTFGEEDELFDVTTAFARDGLRVYPPGETVAGYAGHTFSVCSSTSTALLSVLPVRAGRGVAGVTRDRRPDQL